MKSMTGYGRATARTERYEITAEVHSVNHRFLETSVRLPRSFSYLEEKLKEQVQQKISRGKVEVTLTMQTIGAKSTVVEINHDVVTAYLQAVAAENALLRESGFRRNQIMLGTAADENSNATDALPLSTLLRIPDAFQVQQVADDPDVIWSEVQPVMAEALQQFVAMRETEGKRLADDVAFHLDRLAEMTDATAHALEAERAKAPEAESAKDPAKDEMVEKTPKGDDIGSKLDRILEMLEAKARGGRGEHPFHDESDLDEMVAKLTGKEEGRDDPEAAVTVPAEEMEDACMSPAAKDAAVELLRKVRPAVAAIQDKRERARVVDALLSTVPGPNLVGDIMQAAQDSARKNAQEGRRTNYEKMCADSESAYAARNPHKNKEV